jgi:hypothetical protein
MKCKMGCLFFAECLSFYQPHHIAQRNIGAQPHHQMNMIGDSANADERAPFVPYDSADVWIERFPQFLRYQRLAVFGAEHDVVG